MQIIEQLTKIYYVQHRAVFLFSFVSFLFFFSLTKIPTIEPIIKRVYGFDKLGLFMLAKKMKRVKKKRVNFNELVYIYQTIFSTKYFYEFLNFRLKRVHCS